MYDTADSWLGEGPDSSIAALGRWLVVSDQAEAWGTLAD